MEDFLRLNLGAFLATFAGLVFLTILFIAGIASKSLSGEVKRMGTFLYLLVMVSIFVCVAWRVINQASVNNIPRSTIDRSEMNSNIDGNPNGVVIK